MKKITACSSMLLALLVIGVLILSAGGCNRAGQDEKSAQASPAPVQGEQSARSGASLVDKQGLPENAEAQKNTDQDNENSSGEDASGSEDEQAGGDEQAQNGDEGAAGEGGDESAGGDEGGGNDEGGEQAGPEEGGQQPGEGNQADENDGGEEQPPQEPNPNIDAAALYKSAYCGQCHGDDYAGTLRGPTLFNMADYWNAEELSQFLKEPATYAETDKRLIELGRRYPIIMPPTHYNDEQLYAMAWWLLGLTGGDTPEN